MRKLITILLIAGLPAVLSACMHDGKAPPGTSMEFTGSVARAPAASTADPKNSGLPNSTTWMSF